MLQIMTLGWSDMEKTNCCVRCGQPLNMINEDIAEDKYVIWHNKEYCPQCYLEITEQELNCFH